MKASLLKHAYHCACGKKNKFVAYVVAQLASGNKLEHTCACGKRWLLSEKTIAQLGTPIHAIKYGLTEQKHLRLLRCMTGAQMEQYNSRLKRGYADTKILRNAKSGLVAVQMDLHDKLLGNFRCVLYPDGSVEGGKGWHGRINRWKLKG